jgi:hypothetical protein
MKKLFNYLFAFILLVIPFNSQIKSEDWEDSEETSEEQSGIKKGVYFDLGYSGPAGLSAALGFRYWFASVNIGLAGFANKVPNYAYDYIAIKPGQPLPPNYTEERYPAVIVTGDLSFHYEVTDKITAFASIGYFSQQDTILAYDYKNDLRYYYQYYTTAGACFGVGGEYSVQDDMNLGIGYHTKRGIFARITYIWQ